MNVKDKIQQDLDNLSVSDEVEKLCKTLNVYMVELNNYLHRKGAMYFDYYGGCFKSYSYFNFTKDVLFIVDCGSSMTTVKLSSGDSFSMEFKFYPKTNNLIYWQHTVKSTKAKEDINSLINLINYQIKELLSE